MCVQLFSASCQSQELKAAIVAAVFLVISILGLNDLFVSSSSQQETMKAQNTLSLAKGSPFFFPTAIVMVNSYANRSVCFCSGNSSLHASLWRHEKMCHALPFCSSLCIMSGLPHRFVPVLGLQFVQHLSDNDGLPALRCLYILWKDYAETAQGFEQYVTSFQKC